MVQQEGSMPRWNDDSGEKNASPTTREHTGSLRQKSTDLPQEIS
jgi:hypothetical protein